MARAQAQPQNPTVHEAIGLTLLASGTLLFLALCLGMVGWIFKTGYRLKS